MRQETPTPATVPVAQSGPVMATSAVPRPLTQAEVQAVRARRSELSSQLTSAAGRRDEIAAQIERASGQTKAGLEERGTARGAAPFPDAAEAARRLAGLEQAVDAIASRSSASPRDSAT